MKKILLSVGAGLALSCLSCRSGHFEALSPMPSLSMLLADSSAFGSDQITPGRYTVFMYFRTDCSHCQQETADIVRCCNDLKTLNFVFLTPKPLADLRQYAAFFKLADYSNIRAASDYKRDFWKYYKPARVPYLVVYDRQKRLYRIAEGPLPVDSLKIIAKS